MTVHSLDLQDNVVTFHLSGEVLAVPTAYLREVLEPVDMTRVPGAPDFTTHLINVRGTVVPLADLRVPLKMPRGPFTEGARIIVLELPLAGQNAVVGIFADSVHEVTILSPDGFEDIPAVGTRWPPRFVQGVGRWEGAFVTIPNLEAIFDDFMSAQTGRPATTGTRTTDPANETELE